MRISCKWLSEIVDLGLAEEEPSLVAELLTKRGLEVESIEDLRSGLDKVVTAEILEKNPHPQADRLSLCKVTTGRSEIFDIVCGAQNMKAGDRVALAKIGAALPNGLKISQSKIRGVVSNGMLCSEEELKLKDSSEGILILPPSTPIGIPLAQALGRDDTILTLKLTANRGDCLSHYGIGREFGASIARRPIWPSVPEVSFQGSPISVALEAGEMAPQFYGVLVEGVRVGPSPSWLVQRLEALGSRSINNVVDASNWVMLELGHPTHAYDADLIQGNRICVRGAFKGESLPLLDGTTVTLDGSEIVIADANRAIGLGGVMGGGNSEVQPHTTRVFLECAEFDPKSVRRTATLHQKKTEASHRFERGIDPSRLSYVISRLVGLVTDLAGGKVAGGTMSQIPQRIENPDFWKREIRFGKHFINDLLGFQRDHEPLTLGKIEEILNELDCQVSLIPAESDGGSKDHLEWKVIPPSYRSDLNIREDMAEEVARSLGYDSIPSTIPALSSDPTFASSSAGLITVMARAKQALVESGFHETINFAFTSKSGLEEFDLDSSVRVLNPLSEQHQWMVPSLIPGLVRNALENWNHHFGSEVPAIRLFELRPVFSASGTIEARNQMETGVQEKWKLALILSGYRYAEALRSERGEVDFFDLKAVFDRLVANMGTKGVRYVSLNDPRAGKYPLYHPGQSVEILAGSSAIGSMGLLHPAKVRELKVKAPLWMFEVDWDALVLASRKASEVPVFKSWPEFPQIERDFALVVSEEVSAAKICQVATKVGKPLVKAARVFDVYKGPQISKGMTSIAVRVIFYDERRSLQEAETDVISAQILESWKRELGAELRS